MSTTCPACSPRKNHIFNEVDSKNHIRSACRCALFDKVKIGVFPGILNSTAGITECIRKTALRVFVWVWVTGLAYGLLASGELEVEAAAFEHDQGDEVAEVPVAVAHLDGGLDLVVDGLQASVG